MDIQQHIQKLIDDNNVMLFMKGTPDFPQCGFSGRTVQILQACGVETFGNADVLMDNELRDGIKVFSNWPTIPLSFTFVGNSLVEAIYCSRCIRMDRYRRN
ncbi:MAG: glutaredoxin [Gammaproteobacteria bacterium]|nr:MAG: glutaredoxin [Gammaproteobacteria bacterium]